MDKIFIENLKYYRTSKNKTQKEIAEQLGVVESCYANWEQGRTEPDISRIRQLCEILDITPNHLFEKN